MVLSKASEKIIWPDKIDQGFMKNVIDAFPFDVHALYGLVEIFDIVYSRSTRTACMKLVGLPKICINLAWAKKWIFTWADMAAVIHHELTHKMLLHNKENLKNIVKMPLTPDQENFLLDVRVQGLSYQTMDHPAYQVFWKRYYEDAIYPGSMLYSGARLERYTTRALHREMFSPFGVALQKVAQFVFQDDGNEFQTMESGPGRGGSEKSQDGAEKSAENGANGKDASDEPQEEKSDDSDENTPTERDSDELAEGSNELSEDLNGFAWSPFVGSHDEQEEVTMPSGPMLDYIGEVRREIEGKVDEEIKKREREDATRQLVNKGKIDMDTKQQIRSWGYSDSEFLIDLDEVEDLYSADQRMQRKIMSISMETEELKAKKAIKAMFPDVPSIGPRPNFRDKRAVVLYSMGYWPVFFENMEEDPRGLCHVYIDDSGSQYYVIAFVIRLFSTLRDYLNKDVHFFSTKIWTTSRSNLKSGMEIETTGGTNMNVVVEHALQNKITKCLVITDGYGPLSDKNAKLAEQAKQKYLIGFTDSNHGPGFNAVMWRHFEIPKEGKNENQG